jgi:solute carrier family 35 protein E3
MSENLITAGYAVCNVLSSVALVLLNKKVFAAGFHFPFSLSFFHFCFTLVFYRLLLACGLFELPTKPVSQLEKFKVGAAGVASIGFMNVSLSLNSVGFYQVTKLTIVPVTLVINYFFFGVSTTAKVRRGGLPKAPARRCHTRPGSRCRYPLVSLPPPFDPLFLLTHRI